MLLCRLVEQNFPNSFTGFYVSGFTLSCFGAFFGVEKWSWKKMGQIAPYLKHVVLADDDLDHAYHFRKALQQVDDTCVLTVVRDGAELMDFLSAQAPGFLFLDLNMPCKHGLECLQEIRNDPRLSQMVVLVYTNSTEMTNIRHSYVHKADLYMVKPFSVEQLRNALVSVLKMEWKAAPTPGHYFINNRFVPYTA